MTTRDDMVPLVPVDKGIPWPKRGLNQYVYPWGDLEVGDSFFAAGKTFSQLSGSIAKMRKKTGRRFSMRRATVDDVVGIRVWRIA